MISHSHTTSRIDSSKKDSIEVITSVQRRRRWSPAEKMRIIEEACEPGATVSYVARRHGIPPSQLFYWKRKAEEGAMSGVMTEEKLIPESEHKKALERIKRLERLLGRKTEEVACLRDAVEIAREKNLSLANPCPESTT